MKKYWKLIILSAITIIGLTLFYVENKNVIKTFPQFKIETISGNEKEVDNVIVTGDLYLDWYTNYESFAVNQTGTIYQRETPYFKRLSNYYYLDTQLELLMKEHRNFFRGKDLVTANYTENDQLIAYVNEDFQFPAYESSQFTVSLLDKETSKATTFTVDIPERSSYWYLHIYKVFLEEDGLYVVTENNHRNSEGYEYIVYKIDLGKEDVTEVITLESFDYGQENWNQETQLLFSDDQAINDILISENEVIYEEYTEEYTNNESADVMVYDQDRIETRAIVKVNPETGERVELEIEDDYGVAIHFNENIVTFAKVLRSELVLTQLDITTGDVVQEKNESIDNSLLTMRDFTYNQTIDNKIYLLPQNYEANANVAAPLYIVDLTTLTIEFTGEIRKVDNKIGRNMEHSFYDVTLTK